MRYLCSMCHLSYDPLNDAYQFPTNDARIIMGMCVVVSLSLSHIADTAEWPKERVNSKWYSDVSNWNELHHCYATRLSMTAVLQINYRSRIPTLGMLDPGLSGLPQAALEGSSHSQILIQHWEFQYFQMDSWAYQYWIQETQQCSWSLNRYWIYYFIFDIFDWNKQWKRFSEQFIRSSNTLKILITYEPLF